MLTNLMHWGATQTFQRGGGRGGEITETLKIAQRNNVTVSLNDSQGSPNRHHLTKFLCS